MRASHIRMRGVLTKSHSFGRLANYPAPTIAPVFRNWRLFIAANPPFEVKPNVSDSLADLQVEYLCDHCRLYAA
jgi:hypothetical protein